MRRGALRWGLALATVAGLAGCGGDDLADLKAYTEEVKRRKPGPIEPLPVVKTVAPFVLPANLGRDPFEPDEILEAPKTPAPTDTGIRPDTQRPREELEKYELDTFRMVGTVRQDGVLWALVNVKDGTIHRVRVGNYIGKNYGRIVNITANEIGLVEIYADSAGVWRERPAAVKMADKSENNQ